MSTCALPYAFIQRMQAQLEAEYLDFESAMEATSPVSIRLNPHKQISAPQGAESIPWHPQGYYLPSRPSFTHDPLYHAGAYYVQEASSMLLHHFIDFSQDLHVLDLCAAPGGKSTLLLSALTPGSVLVANEVIRSRAGILAENLSRWGHPNVMVTQRDPSYFQKTPDTFDVIVIDAPCSGEGLFRKQPESVAQWTSERNSQNAQRQKRILADILPALKPGGYLVYSTCTFAREENEGVIEWLLEEFPNELEPAPLEGLEPFGVLTKSVKGVTGYTWRCYPHRMQGEGFFIARLRKKGIPKASPPPARKSKKKQTNASSKLPPEVQHFADTWIRPEYHSQLVLHKDMLFISPLTSALSQSLIPLTRISIKSGILVGKAHRKGINPQHELALSTCIRSDVPHWEVDRETALTFLKRENLPRSEKKLPQGWVVMRYQEKNLGWVKGVGKQIKNHFPVNWRIRTGAKG